MRRNMKGGGERVSGGEGGEERIEGESGGEGM